LERDARRIRYEDLKELIDFAFIALHGKYGDDGCIQGLLELLGIPYTGSGVLCSAICMDKYMAHKILMSEGIEVAKEIAITEKLWRSQPELVIKMIKEEIGFPCVIKPNREGSSIGVNVVHNEDEIPAAMEGTEIEQGLKDVKRGAFHHDTLVLVEEYLDGLEFSCIVLGNENPKVLLPTEIIACRHSSEPKPEDRVFTYKKKYKPGAVEKRTPARVTNATLRRIQEEVLKAYKVLGFKNYGRIDGYVVGGKWVKNEGNSPSYAEHVYDGYRVLITDPNTSSGMGPGHLIYPQAAKEGMRDSQLLDRLIELALEAHSKKRGTL
jgi:D-alanine-D-alanine ligase